VAFAPAVPGAAVAGSGYSAEATSFARPVAAAGRFDLSHPYAAAASSVTAIGRSIGRCHCKIVDTRSTSRVSSDERGDPQGTSEGTADDAFDHPRSSALAARFLNMVGGIAAPFKRLTLLLKMTASCASLAKTRLGNLPTRERVKNTAYVSVDLAFL